jgi:hypothetical protein
MCKPAQPPERHVNKLHKAFVALLVLSVATGAHAALMSESVPGVGTLRNDNAGGTGFSSVKVTGYSGRAGEFDGHFYPGAFTADSFFRFFCTEISQTAIASATYTASLWDNQDLKRLFDIAFPNKTVGDFYDGGVTTFGEFSDADAAAAFQMAIWELVLDPGDKDLSGGAFQVVAGSPAAITAMAQGWIDDLASSTTWQYWTIVRFTNATRQDYTTGLYRVPEPATLVLLAGGLLLLAFVQRRR